MELLAAFTFTAYAVTVIYLILKLTQVHNRAVESEYRYKLLQEAVRKGDRNA